MTPSKRAVDLIKKFEGFYADSYLCPAGVPTIGFGSTMWSDGKKVKLGQRISMEEAEKLLMWEITNKAIALPVMSVNQNMFDAIVSFVYNLGLGAFLRSTLYKKIQQNPFDESIRNEFMKWSYAKVKGEMKQLKGLMKRRTAEANLYYEKI
jgi:lysozyme